MNRWRKSLAIFAGDQIWRERGYKSRAVTEVNDTMNTKVRYLRIL